jgi:hypothetical protein
MGKRIVVTVLGGRLARKLEISKAAIDVKLHNQPNITIRLHCGVFRLLTGEECKRLTSTGLR